MAYTNLPVTFRSLTIFAVLAALCAMALMYVNKLIGRLFGGYTAVYTFFLFVFAIMIILRRSSSYFFGGKMKFYTSTIIAFPVFFVTLIFNEYFHTPKYQSPRWPASTDFIDLSIYSLVLALIYCVVFYFLNAFLKKVSM